MAYHRTNPLFDRIVVPFFLMLKHVALHQGMRCTIAPDHCEQKTTGIREDGTGYELDSLREAELRFVERFFRLISRGMCEGRWLGS